MSDKTILERFMPFKKALLVWASPKMIETWDAFEVAGSDPEAMKDARATMLRLDDILRAMRSDLGHDDSALPRGKLVSLILVAEERGVVLE
ncbi:MAG: hypothetical protein OXU63_01325 [Acidobacteriota bacterium]|nr:hypothetical protein [Acidobacteriota bacterium]